MCDKTAKKYNLAKDQMLDWSQPGIGSNSRMRVVRPLFSRELNKEASVNKDSATPGKYQQLFQDKLVISILFLTCKGSVKVPWTQQ